MHKNLSSIALVVDCRQINAHEFDYYALNIWGKPCFDYVCAMVDSMEYYPKYLLTDSKRIANMLKWESFNVVTSLEQVLENVVALISGTAIFLKKNTICEMLETYTGGVLCVDYQSFIYTFDKCDFFDLRYRRLQSKSVVIFGKDDNKSLAIREVGFSDAFVIDSKYAFELAIVLKKKELSLPLLTKAIIDRIEEKKPILCYRNDSNTICLIGHSQIDNWDIQEIAGYNVQNCGIRGISSFEYEKYILSKNIIQCNADVYLVMHGTNDIVTDHSDKEIIESISHTFDYIEMRKPYAKIYFLSCAHVNGRLDRNNKRITNLNEKLLDSFQSRVVFINTCDLDDEFGDLRSEYTKDGLHFSDKGYVKLKDIVEKKITIKA